METTHQTRVCICSVAHSLPITDREVFDALEMEWSEKQIELWFLLPQIHLLGDFYEAHVTPELWSQFTAELEADVCPWNERHRRT